MIGVALEGGAERSSFTAGVMDALMAHDFYAGAASGTSAGAGCVLNYRSGQQGVALEMMIMERHSRYFGIRHMAHTGRFLNLDHMAHEYASRISWDAYRHPSMQTDFVATCCEDGKPAYLTDAGSKQRLFTAIKASCALPIICEPVELDGRHYVDGSIVDPIPFLHLLEQGCDKVLVVLTGNENAHPTDYTRLRLLLRRLYYKKYPMLYHAILTRIACYERQVQAMEQAQKEKKVLVLRPQVQADPAVHPERGKNSGVLPPRLCAHGTALGRDRRFSGRRGTHSNMIACFAAGTEIGNQKRYAFVSAYRFSRFWG